MKVEFTGKPLRILDFDCECRPLSYLGQDFTTAEITAIACAWIVNGKPQGRKCWLLGDPRLGDTIGAQAKAMLLGFLKEYNKADIVTGHYIRGFDLSLVNGSLLDNGFGPLASKLAHDTKNDLKKRKYMSASQENLAATLGLEHPKIKMNTPSWREANRLGPKGLRLTRKRVVGDVVQHIELREELMRRGWLGNPKLWTSSGSLTGAYIP